MNYIVQICISVDNNDFEMTFPELWQFSKY